MGSSSSFVFGEGHHTIVNKENIPQKDFIVSFHFFCCFASNCFSNIGPTIASFLVIHSQCLLKRLVLFRSPWSRRTMLRRHRAHDDLLLSITSCEKCRKRDTKKKRVLSRVRLLWKQSWQRVVYKGRENAPTRVWYQLS